MSLGEADAKFPGELKIGQQQEAEAERPCATRENPGAVYPKSSPTAAKPQEIPGSRGALSYPRFVLSNPFEFQDELNGLKTALDRVINAIEKEMPAAGRDLGAASDASAGATGASEESQPDVARFFLGLREKFEQWKREVREIALVARHGHDAHGRAERSDGDERVPDIGSQNKDNDGKPCEGLFND